MPSRGAFPTPVFGAHMSLITKFAVLAVMAFTLGCGGGEGNGNGNNNNTGGGNGNTGGGNGNTGGGSGGGSGGGGGDSGPADFKKTCTESTDCSSRICLVKGNDQYGYCTKSCESFTECPTF